MSDTDDVEAFLELALAVREITKSMSFIYDLVAEIRDGFIERAHVSPDVADRMTEVYFSNVLLPMIMAGAASVDQ